VACRLGALGKPAVAAGGAHLKYALTRLPLVWLDGVTSLLVPIGRAPPSLYERYQHPSAAWWAAAATVSVALIVLMLWRRGLVGWAIASFLCVLAPVALLTFDEGWYGWGRYLYPSLPAMALIIGTLVEKRRVARVGAAIVAAAMAASTFLAARDWHDDRSFSRAMTEDHPEASMGWSELAAVELRENHPAEALADVERALERAPRNYRHWSRAASALMRLDRRPEAYQAAARALALEPDDANAHYVTAIRFLGERREAEAAAQLLEALRLEPEQDGPWNTLTEARAHLGADSAFARAVAAAASDPRYAGIAARLR
jgi:tetratricopeptide (TPR) repeat protein